MATVADLLRQITARAEPGLWWWQGASGAWYIHSVYQIQVVPDFGACNYIFAGPRFDRRRQPFYIGESGDFGERIDRHEKFLPALWLGATEVHVHLLATSRQQRLDIETDLRRGHPTPLNEQRIAGFRPSSLASLADILKVTR
jgi:hypothetical protein